MFGFGVFSYISPSVNGHSSLVLDTPSSSAYSYIYYSSSHNFHWILACVNSHYYNNLNSGGHFGF